MLEVLNRSKLLYNKKAFLLFGFYPKIEKLFKDFNSLREIAGYSSQIKMLISAPRVPTALLTFFITVTFLSLS